MEYSQTRCCCNMDRSGRIVLILILMEYSQTQTKLQKRLKSACLNPYSNGILTDHSLVEVFYQPSFVLILILMEYSQTSH